MSDHPTDHYEKYRMPDRLHHTQSLWQIWVPLIVVALLMTGLLAATLLVTGAGVMDIGLVQNTAIILLIMPMALIGLLAFIALGVAIVGTSQLIKIVPRLRLISMHLDSINASITIWANRAMLPFIIGRRIREKLVLKKRQRLD
jgi:hypothetical protein